MNRRRLEMLQEMGLTPVWRLRETAEAVQGDGAGEATAVRRGAAESGPVTPKAVVEVQTVTARAPGVNPAGERRAQIMQMDWLQLKECVAGCIACPLHKTRSRTVFGVGDERAQWLFVGEGPGAEEDAQGEPFVGQAGKLLDNMLAAIKLKRGSNVYIANVVKCRPPNNRNPEPEEALACEPHLHRQIELIQPKLIVALGRVAAVNLLAREASIASLRGKVHQYRGTPLIVTYHPAYLLRTLPDKAKAWVDLRFAMETMKGLQNQPAATI
jgi:uracil-DNA glycosylase family 4